MEDHAARKERLRKIIRSLGAAEDPPLHPDAYSRAAIVATVKGVAAHSLAAWCCTWTGSNACPQLVTSQGH